MNSNLLSLNVAKTKYITFSLKELGRNNNLKLKMHSVSCKLNYHTCSCSEIESTDRIKYLGMIVDQNLNWKHHVSFIASKMRKMLPKLYVLRKMVSTELLRMFYFAVVQSIIQYGITCFGGTYISNVNPIIALQNHIVKLMSFKSFLDPPGPAYTGLNVMSFRTIFVKKAVIYYYLSLQHSNRPNDMPHYLTRGVSNGLVPEPFVTKTKTKKSLTCQAPKFFNLLPINIRQEKNFRKFTTLTEKWLKEIDVNSLFNVVE